MRSKLTKEALSIWVKWLVTRPLVFGLTAYQVLRLQLILGRQLMDSTVGDPLLERFRDSNPRTERLANLQASVGRLQLEHIDAFNEGARRNAHILTEELGEVPGVRAPAATGDHIYVYYPLSVDPDRRSDLRDYLLRHGIDTKTTDMADCSTLTTFGGASKGGPPTEASVLEICVYPTLSAGQMRRIARKIRAWARLPAISRASAKPEGASLAS